jgi:hypothetical protein
MSILRKIKALWMAFAHVLGQVQTAILLSVVYHVAVGPIALVSKALRRDLLTLRRPEGASFAEPLPPISSTIERARRQF